MPSSKPYTVTEPFTEQDFKLYYQLRYEVLRKPWKQPLGSEVDETDNTSLHALIKENDTALACARLHFVDEKTAQIRYMAVNAVYQGKGLGKDVIRFLEQKAQENGRNHIILHSRVSAVDFYTKCEYKVVEPSYLLWGEIPHFLMERFLREEDGARTHDPQNHNLML